MARVTVLSTGIQALDETLGGGIAAGSIVVLSAAPASQSGLLLSKLADARRTLYLSTIHSISTIEGFLDRAGVDPDRHTIRKVGAGTPLESAYAHVRDVPHGSNLVIDAMDPLESGAPAEFWSFLNAVRDHLESTGGIAFLHCTDGRLVPPLRDTTEYVADVVFDLETAFDGEEIVNQLLVPKVRGERAITSAIKLDLSEGVTVDTSRDIG